MSTPNAVRVLEDVLDALGLGDDESITIAKSEAALAVIRLALSEHEDAVIAAHDEQRAIERRHGAGRE